MLDERKKRILQAIIDDYVSTAEPIGSRTIAKKYDMGLSPATIRNEMSDLEDMGYLEQPHTSAGRVPSDKGYRLYVDELMDQKVMSAEELESIKGSLIDKITAIEQIMKQASAILSSLTHYTSIALVQSIKQNTIRHIQLMPIDKTNAVLIIVTDNGVIKNNIVKLPESACDEFVNKFSKLLNEKLHGLTIESITLPVIQDMQKEMGINKDLLMPILDVITESIQSIEDSDIYLDGISNILYYPEYSNIEKARQFMSVLKEKDTICKLLSDSAGEGVKISIGSENYIQEMDDCSLISTSYDIGGKTIGKIGVIGPRRMDYSKVITTMNSVRNQLYYLFEDWLFK